MGIVLSQDDIWILKGISKACEVQVCCSDCQLYNAATEECRMDGAGGGTLPLLWDLDGLKPQKSVL